MHAGYAFAFLFVTASASYSEPIDAMSKPAEPRTNSLPPSDQLIFGLGRLHWGMSPREVQEIYPALKQKTPRPETFPLTSLSTLYVSDYTYQGCTFDGALRFEGGELRTIEFDLAASTDKKPSCADTMELEFAAQYRTPVSYFKAGPPSQGAWHPFNGYYGIYKGTFTSAFFEATPHVSFGFSDAVKRPSITVIDAAPASR